VQLDINDFSLDDLNLQKEIKQNSLETEQQAQIIHESLGTPGSSKN